MSHSHGSHEQFVAHGTIKTSSDRSFGIVFAVFFTIIGLFPLLGDGGPRWWAIGVGAAFLGLALLFPSILAPLNRLWTKFVLLLHRIVNPLVMGLLFFLVVTPIALIMRVLGKRPLDLELDPDAASYWIQRDPPGPAPETMKQQF